MPVETLYRPSQQTRPAYPVEPSAPHPRAVAMASVLLDIKAVSGNATFKDLCREGFRASEITEFFQEAEKLALDRETHQVRPDPDRLADMIAKARAPFPQHLPLPPGTGESQVLLIAWGHYCVARSALLLDPWSGQRERCLEKLRAYLDKLPLFPSEKTKIVRAVAETLRQVTA